jgi:transposase
VQQRLVEVGLLKGKTIAIDATTLEASAAMRSIVRRGTALSLCQEDANSVMLCGR